MATGVDRYSIREEDELRELLEIFESAFLIFFLALPIMVPAKC